MCESDKGLLLIGNLFFIVLLNSVEHSLIFGDENSLMLHSAHQDVEKELKLDGSNSGDGVAAAVV